MENLNNSQNPMFPQMVVPPFHTSKMIILVGKTPWLLGGNKTHHFCCFHPEKILRLPGWSSAATNKSPGWMPARCAGPSGSRPATWGQGHHWYSLPWSGTHKFETTGPHLNSSRHQAISWTKFEFSKVICKIPILKKMLQHKIDSFSNKGSAIS